MRDNNTPSGCKSHQRHWFTVKTHVGVRTPRCVRCGAPNSSDLTSDDWELLRSVDWAGLTEGEKAWIDEMVNEGWPVSVGGEADV